MPLPLWKQQHRLQCLRRVLWIIRIARLASNCFFKSSLGESVRNGGGGPPPPGFGGGLGFFGDKIGWQMRLSLLSLMFLAGCSFVTNDKNANRYAIAYKKILDSKSVPMVEPLKLGEPPKVLIDSGSVTDDKNKNELISNGYVLIGGSIVEGEKREDDLKKIQEHAISVGASVASLQLIPLRGKDFGHVAWFFVKSKNKGRLGLITKSLDSEDREKYKRNTGAIVSYVINRSPAFYSNLIPGDILVELNGVQLDSSEHFVELVRNIPFNENKADLKIIRLGVERLITVDLGKDQRER